MDGFTVKQLAFDLADAPRPTLDNFVIARNAELVQHLRELGRSHERERSIYIWGQRGSGRTHLLEGSVAELAQRGRRACYLGAGAPPPDHSHEIDLAAIDDVDLLNEAGQSVLFNLYNDVRERGGIVLAAGNAPPGQLPLRADVVTRLAWGLVYEVHALTDDEKMHALAQRAAARGFDLLPEVTQYLLSRVPRDMRTLIAMVDALDRYSLETKRAVTLALAREMLQERGGSRVE
jgi:DnaA-homolog protein